MKLREPPSGRRAFAPAPEGITRSVGGLAGSGSLYITAMLATQVRQKDSVFYFAAYPAEDLLDRVRFISRFYAEGEKSIAAEEAEAGDDVAHFIGKIERTDGAFQREMSRSKVGQ